MKRHLLLSAACSAFLANFAFGAPATSEPAHAPAAAPATAPAAGVAMKIFVVEVKGLVQVRMSETQPWQMAKVGMELTQGAEFRTGPRSSVSCQIPPDQTIVLDRLGTIKIDEAIRNGGAVKTDMVMKYGRTHYDIEAAGAEHQSTIRSPTSTLAVRGTFVSLYDQPPFTPEAESIHGQAAFRNAHRELRFGGTTPMFVTADKNSVADTALAKAAVDPTSSKSRTKSEQRYISDQTSKSAIFSLDDSAQIPIIRDGPPPPTDAQLLSEVPSLPGKLDIVMRWQGNANLNLVVGDQAGTNGATLLTTSQTQPLTEFLYPGFGLNHGAKGGTIPYDNQGGPNGGMEIAYWKGNNYPRGFYGISSVLESGGPALVTFNVFQNGKELNNMVALEVDSQGHLVQGAAGTPLAGLPINVMNSQITRPLSSTEQPNAFDLTFAGPNIFRDASVQVLIPSKLDNDIPPSPFSPIQEPPVTFPPPTPTKTGKVRATTAVKPANSTSVSSTPPRNAPMPADTSRESRPMGKSR
ncbi:MAG TPA: hypothetical protein VFE47_31220 [Tepidisphaeraceae bacterium]|jgi:hypothetical protein|nr:hypothetical protein [Tepidisphaeraceae bacterium]